MFRKLASLTRPLLRLFGEAFSAPEFPAPMLWRHVFVQKIIGINRHVPWPVHWTTEVKAAGKIDRGTRLLGLSMGCYLDGRNGITFGANTWLGPGVKVISMNHDLSVSVT